MALGLALLLGAGCQSVENKQALANIEARQQAAADHQTRARLGYEAIQTRLDAGVERIVAALQGHPYRGGEFAGTQLSGISVERTQPLTDGELRIRLDGPAA